MGQKVSKRLTRAQKPALRASLVLEKLCNLPFDVLSSCIKSEYFITSAQAT